MKINIWLTRAVFQKQVRERCCEERGREHVVRIVFAHWREEKGWCGFVFETEKNGVSPCETQADFMLCVYYYLAIFTSIILSSHLHSSYLYHSR